MSASLPPSNCELQAESGASRRRLIKGRYDAASMECHWTKTYVGAHDVFYKGFREGKGIWGTWEIGLFGHGGFKIWPRNAGDGEEESEMQEEPQIVEAIGKKEEAVGAGKS